MTIEQLDQEILEHRAALYQLDCQRAQIKSQLDALELERSVLLRPLYEKTANDPA